jgi:hypothetical protein
MSHLPADLLKAHYKSDFHQYNLKRKMVTLGPICETEFEGKKRVNLSGQAVVENQQEVFWCKPCGKTFASKVKQD